LLWRTAASGEGIRGGERRLICFFFSSVYFFSFGILDIYWAGPCPIYWAGLRLIELTSLSVRSKRVFDFESTSKFVKVNPISSFLIEILTKPKGLRSCHRSVDEPISMVAMLTPNPTDPSFVLPSLLCTEHEQIDRMYEEIKNLATSFSATEKDGVDDDSARSELTNERNLICLSNVQSIAECIHILRSLEPSLHYGLGNKLVDVEEMSSKGEIVQEPVLLGGEEEHEIETKSESTTARIEVEEFDAYRSKWELLWRPARKFEDMS
jgi:hypothetical protein